MKWDINHLREYDDVLDAVVTEKAQIIDSREFNDVTLIDCKIFFHKRSYAPK